MATIIQRCSCGHEGQDKLHGRGMRVYNEAKAINKDTGVWRCTVCRKEVQGKPSVKVDAKK